MRKEKNSIAYGVVAGAISAIVTSLLFQNFSGEQLGTNVVGSDDGLAKIIEQLDGKDFVSQEDLVVATVKQAKPAVVSVIITKDVPVVEQYYEDVQDPFGGMFGSPFNFQIPQYRENGTEKKEVGGGSGFIVSEDGYIVTNKHVVFYEAAEYTVFTEDGTKYEAKVAARDPLNDVAILKIEAKNLPFLEFGDSEKLESGQSVIAIGNPLLEFSNSVSVGVISGLSRSITASSGFGQSEQLEGVIQTDAAINPGNSGGPLLNLKGEVIGVNVAVADAQGIGFALPGGMVKKAFESVKENGKIVRPFLGVRYIQINEAIKEANKLEVDYGVLVLRGQKAEELAVIPGSPADKAGLLENDIILEADGKKLDEETSLARIIAGKNIGDKIKLKVLSKGKEKEVEVTLEELDK